MTLCERCKKQIKKSKKKYPTVPVPPEHMVGIEGAVDGGMMG